MDMRKALIPAVLLAAGVALTGCGKPDVVTHTVTTTTIHRYHAPTSTVRVTNRPMRVYYSPLYRHNVVEYYDDNAATWFILGAMVGSSWSPWYYPYDHWDVNYYNTWYTQNQTNIYYNYAPAPSGDPIAYGQGNMNVGASGEPADVLGPSAPNGYNDGGNVVIPPSSSEPASGEPNSTVGPSVSTPGEPASGEPSSTVGPSVSTPSDPVSGEPNTTVGPSSNPSTGEPSVVTPGEPVSVPPSQSTDPSISPTEPTVTPSEPSIAPPSEPTIAPSDPSEPTIALPSDPSNINPSEPSEPSEPVFTPNEPSEPSFTPSEPSEPSFTPSEPSEPSYSPSEPSEPSYLPSEPSEPSED